MSYTVTPVATSPYIGVYTAQRDEQEFNFEELTKAGCELMLKVERGASLVLRNILIDNALHEGAMDNPMTLTTLAEGYEVEVTVRLTPR